MSKYHCCERGGNKTVLNGDFSTKESAYLLKLLRESTTRKEPTDGSLERA